MFDRQEQHVSFEQGLEWIREEQRTALCGEFSWMQVIGLFDNKKAQAAAADVRRTGAPKLAVWRRICRETDMYAKVVSRQMREQKKFEIPCYKNGAGCNVCCRRIVRVQSKIEQWAIRRAFNSMPMDSKIAVIRQIEEMKFLLEEARGVHGHTTTTDVPLSQEEHDVIERRFEELGGYCPFLGQSGGCTIYDDRPPVCRLMMVVGDKCEIGQRRNGVFPVDVMQFINQLCRTSGEVKDNLISVMR